MAEEKGRVDESRGKMCGLLKIIPSDRTFSETEELIELLSSKAGHELAFFCDLPRTILEPLLRHIRYVQVKRGEVLCQSGNMAT